MLSIWPFNISAEFSGFQPSVSRPQIPPENLRGLYSAIRILVQVPVPSFALNPKFAGKRDPCLLLIHNEL